MTPLLLAMAFAPAAFVFANYSNDLQITLTAGTSSLFDSMTCPLSTIAQIPR